MDTFWFIWGNVDIRNPEFKGEGKPIMPDDDNGSEDECF